MKQFELGKRYKLCGEIRVNKLFTGGDSQSALCYPLKGVWRKGETRRGDGATCQFVITVPKKRLRHAVDRVAARRRIREAYRLTHGRIEAESRAIGNEEELIDVAFIYVANKVLPSVNIHAAMARLLGKIYKLSQKKEDGGVGDVEPRG